MSLLRPFARGLRALVRGRAADREVADEVQHYVDEAAAAYEAQGLPQDQARRAARADVGSMTAVRDQVRSAGWEHTVGTFLTDLRYGARRLRDNPGFSLVCILTLGLGIGATTAIFSAVNPILFKPLPYPDADRILAISDFGAGGKPLAVTFGTFREIASRSRSFEAEAAFKAWRPTFVEREQTERLEGQRVSAPYFRVLGVQPATGREFQDSEDRPRGQNVVIVSDTFWRRQLASDPDVLGRTLKLDGVNFTIIGVMPAGFENVLAPEAQLWAPLQYDPALPFDGREWGHHLAMAARLRPGVTTAQARAELNGIAAAPIAQFARPAWADLSSGLMLRPLQVDLTGAVRPALVAILGAVLLVLAIACVNVTNLLLARGARRRGEFAVRAALGAGRVRLVRQLLTESLLLAGIGGAAGLCMAAFGVQALIAMSPPGLPRVNAIRLDVAVFAFALVVTTIIGIAVGLVPAIQASRSTVQDGLQHVARRATGNQRFTRSVLVVGEVALACLLLVAAGLLLRSLERLFSQPVGFEAAHVMTMQVIGSAAALPDDASKVAFFNRAIERIGELPGVRAAAFTTQLPLSGDLDGYGAHFEIDRDSSSRDAVLRYVVTSGYFRTLGIPLLRGRLFDTHDNADGQHVALISESLAASKFGKADPIGQRFVIGGDSDWYTVVGVVGNVRQTSLAAPLQDAVYLPHGQTRYVQPTMSLVARSDADAQTMLAAFRRAIWSVDRNVAFARVAAMDDLVTRSEADRRFALTLFEAFGLTALLLAALGINGVLSGSVAERTREIGVRVALGASRDNILTLVVRQGMTLAGVGAAIGLAGGLAASRALTTLLFGISRVDPVTYAAVAAVLAVVALAACALPAFRAARIDPAVTLRAD